MKQICFHAFHPHHGEVYLLVDDLDAFILADADADVFAYHGGPDADHCTTVRKGDLNEFRLDVDK